MKKIPSLLILLIFIFLSCVEEPPVVPETGNFWAQDMRTNKHYRVDAEQLVTGKYCTVWVEKSSGVTSTQAQQIANEFDDNIYQEMINNFGINITKQMITNVLGNINIPKDTYNTMEFADFLADRDGKLCILLLDIKDNYEKGVNESYVAGYFWNGDFMKINGSNERDMIYIDTDPGMGLQTISEAYSTLAHEMQHLMNFTTSYVKRYEKAGNKITISSMDTWINEGLSSAAEYVYTGKHLQGRVDWYKKNGNGSVKGLIDQGNTFFVWGNREGENIYANQDDYSTVYLFFQWLRLQSGSTDIYKKIISSTKTNHEAVLEYISDYTTWDALLKTWLAANRINATNGIYGYKNDDTLKTIKVPAPATLASSIKLFPGEGVYSKIGTSFNMPTDGTNIKHAILSSSDIVSTASNGYTLLTYNQNTELKGASESGTTTGMPIASPNIMAMSASVQYQPLRIDAGDMLRQSTYEINIGEWKIEHKE